MKFVYVFIICLFASVSFGDPVYIDPDATYNGDGTTGTQAAGAGQAGAYNTWDSVTFNISNDYYQKCGTTWSDSGSGASITISGKDATSENRMVLGAYYLDGGSEVIGVSGAKPILNQTPHDDYLLYILNSDYLHIKNLDLRGGYKQIGIRGGVSYLLMEDCIVGKGAYQYGIYAHALTTPADPNNYGVIRNCTFDSDIGNSGATPADEGGALQDGIFLLPGNNYWEIHDSNFIDWPHAAISLTGYSGYNNQTGAINTYNKVYNNHIYRVATGSYNYSRGIGILGDSTIHHNEVYYNLIEGMTVRAKLGGYRNKYYYNIFDTMNDTSGRSNRPASAILITGSDWASTDMYAVENEFTNNIIINTDNTGIMVGSNTVKEVKDNIIANNIIYNCGNAYDGSYANYVGTGLLVDGSSNVLQNKYYNNDIYNSSYTDVVLWKTTSNRYTVAEFNALDGTDDNVMQNNIAGDPLLKDVDNDDFRLSAGSPAIGAALITYTNATDYIGTTVPQGADPDIGALEFVILEPGPEDGVEFNPAGKYLRFDTGGIPLVIP